MKLHYFFVCVAFLSVVGCSPSGNGEGAGGASGEQMTWMTDFPAALARAAAENKPVLVNFSGSDWCGWCIRLDEEVFSQPEFTAYAENALIPVVLDFPRRSSQSAELKQQNEKLANKYGIRGFPTVLLLDAEGTVLATTGYQAGGAEAYVEHLKELLGK